MTDERELVLWKNCILFGVLRFISYLCTLKACETTYTAMHADNILKLKEIETIKQTIRS